MGSAQFTAQYGTIVAQDQHTESAVLHANYIYLQVPKSDMRPNLAATGCFYGPLQQVATDISLVLYTGMNFQDDCCFSLVVREIMQQISNS